MRSSIPRFVISGIYLLLFLPMDLYSAYPVLKQFGTNNNLINHIKEGALTNKALTMLPDVIKRTNWIVVSRGSNFLTDGIVFNAYSGKVMSTSGRRLGKDFLGFAISNGELIANPNQDNGRIVGHKRCDLGVVSIETAVALCPDESNGCSSSWGNPPTVLNHVYAFRMSGLGYMLVRIVSFDGKGGATVEWARIESNSDIIVNAQNPIPRAGEHIGEIDKSFVVGRWEPYPMHSNPTALTFDGQHVKWEQSERRPTTWPYRFSNDTLYLYSDSNDKFEWYPVARFTKVHQDTMWWGEQGKMVRSSFPDPAGFLGFWYRGSTTIEITHSRGDYTVTYYLGNYVELNPIRVGCKLSQGQLMNENLGVVYRLKNDKTLIISRFPIVNPSTPIKIPDANGSEYTRLAQ